jgi:glutamate synthase (NADPH/NADH) small chain
MASTCPKCHQVIEDDSVCCAEVKYTWKCKACGKLSTGFVVPYGRCFLCGGENEVIQGYSGARPDQVAIVREAVQYEIDMFQFYRIAKQRTSSAELQPILEELYHKEEDHLTELDEHYHLHLDPRMRELPGRAEQLLSQWIFSGIDFSDGEHHVLAVYEKAIAMERRTRDHFQARADALEPGQQKEIYRELAAEEEEHVSILETEREQFLKP